MHIKLMDKLCTPLWLFGNFVHNSVLTPKIESLISCRCQPDFARKR